MRTLRRLLRVPALTLHAALGCVVILCCIGWDRVRGAAFGQGLGRRAQVFWCRSICRLMGVRIEPPESEPVQPPVLLVSNHVSWLDILVISAHWPVSFLSKSEVRRWPGIGPVATALGTLYIDRGARNASAQAVTVMGERLRAGYRVVFFPEGTTSAGDTLLPFRPRLYQAAIDAGVPVQPITLQYLDRNGALSALVPFTGVQRLPGHVLRLAGEPSTTCRVRVGEPVSALEHGRSALASRTRQQMLRLLELEHEDRTVDASRVRA